MKKQIKTFPILIISINNQNKSLVLRRLKPIEQKWISYREMWNVFEWRAYEISMTSFDLKWTVSMNHSHFPFHLFSQIRKDQDQFVFTSTGPVYPYSSQKLNASENALEQMRTYLKKVRSIHWLILSESAHFSSIIVLRHAHSILIIDLEPILPIQTMKLSLIIIEHFVHH